MNPGHASGPSVAAASVLVRDLFIGPVRAAAVVAAGSAATYLDVEGRLLAVVGAGGVQLPCAVVSGRSTVTSSLTSRSESGGRHHHDDLAVGAGAIHHDGRPIVAVCRWFDPKVRVPIIDSRAIDRFATLVGRRRQVDPMLPANAVERLAEDLAAGDAHGAVAALLGRGTGLTPAGDDLLAGALAALRARGSPAADALGRAVRGMARAATSRLSAALLDAADAGAVVPEAAAVLRALAGFGPSSLDAATGRLVALGHTSGWHLAAGLLVGVTQARGGVSQPVPAFEGDGPRSLRTPVRAPAGGPATAGRAS
jgi:Protein of unknown function (DUF2877)